MCCTQKNKLQLYSIFKITNSATQKYKIRKNSCKNYMNQLAACERCAHLCFCTIEGSDNGGLEGWERRILVIGLKERVE